MHRAGMQAEYLPAWVEQTRDDSLVIIREMQPVSLDPGKGRVQVVHWKARDIALDVDLAESAEIIIRQYYFPGWQASINGVTPVTVEPGETNRSVETGTARWPIPA